MAREPSASDKCISFEDYLIRVRQDPEHAYEYLDGRITMMTGGSPDHAIIGSNINGILRERLRGRRCIVSTSDVYLQLSERYRVCPDITVSCDPRDRGVRDVIRSASLVVEVLSPTTEANERGLKSLQYRAYPSIQEYLLISAQFPLVELFRREKQGFWSLYTLELGGTVELTSLGLRIPVADLSQGISLLEETPE